MGAYIAFGLNYGASVSKSQLAGLTEDQLLSLMVEKLDFPAENYVPVPHDQDILFQLRPEVLEHQLIPLLERVYPLFYPKGDHSEGWWLRLTQTLASMPPASWLSWIVDKGYEYGKFGDFVVELNADDWATIRTASKQAIAVDYRNIRLMIEGKIRFEEFDKSHRFFQYCMSHAFPDLPLGKSLRLYYLG